MRLKHMMGTFSAVAVVGLGLLLSGCGEQAGAAGATGSDAGSSAQDAAKNAFLAERGGGGTPVVNAQGTPVAGGGRFGGRGGGLFGSVTKVDADKITVKSQADGTETLVQLASGAKIEKQGEAQKADIKEGEPVLAIGTKNGDTVEAQTVQVGAGGFGGAGFGPGGTGRPFAGGTPRARANGGDTVFPGGTPPPGGQFFSNNGNGNGTPTVRDIVAGTVEKVEGDTVTVKLQDGLSSTFTLGANTRLTKQVEVKITDIKEGDMVVVSGAKNGDVYEATSVRIMEPLSVPVP